MVKSPPHTRLPKPSAGELPVVELPTPTNRVCIVCGTVRPVTSFRSKEARCDTCRSRQDRERQRAKMEDLKNTLMQVAAGQIAAMARGDNLEAPRVSQLVGVLYEKLDGIDKVAEKFATLLTDATENALRTKVGYKTALDYYRALFKLTELSNQHIDRSMEAAAMTQEELEAAIEGRIVQVALKTYGDENEAAEPLALEHDEHAA